MLIKFSGGNACLQGCSRCYFCVVFGIAFLGLSLLMDGAVEIAVSVMEDGWLVGGKFWFSFARGVSNQMKEIGWLS